MKFYNVKKRAFVEVADSNCKKAVYKRETAKGVQERFAVRASDNGTKLTKFVTKKVYDSLQYPTE